MNTLNHANTRQLARHAFIAAHQPRLHLSAQCTYGGTLVKNSRKLHPRAAFFTRAYFRPRINFPRHLYLSLSLSLESIGRHTSACNNVEYMQIRINIERVGTGPVRRAATDEIKLLRGSTYTRTPLSARPRRRSGREMEIWRVFERTGARQF